MSEFKFTLIDKAKIPPFDSSSKHSKYKDMTETLLKNPEKSICLPATLKAKAQVLRSNMRTGIQSVINKKERGRWKVRTRIRNGVVFIWIEEIK